ncbi:hypothetical protein CsatB_000835 [Cannabis sativa]
MVRSLCDNSMTHDSECNNSNDESYESCWYNEEGLLDESVDNMTLEDEEEHSVIDSTSSMILTNKPPMDPYISSTPYYILYKLRKSSPQAHHAKSYVVGVDFGSNSSLAKLEGKYNNNFQVVLHDAYYGRQPLINVALR